MTTHMRKATTMTLVKAIGIAAGLIVAFAATGADESAPVQKPDVKVGDHWRYKVSIHQTNVPTVVVFDSRVSFVGPNAIVAVETGSDGKESDSQFDADWGISSLGYVGQVFDPPARFFKFPLQVGAEYPYAYGLAAERGTQAQTKEEGTVKVTGWEDVTVPAGKFRALKLEAKGSFRRLDNNFSGARRIVLWYVPEIKRTAKSTLEGGRFAANLDMIRTTELVEFKVQ
jgi:hypothetical protein